MPRVQSEYEVETIFLDRLQEMNYEYIELNQKLKKDNKT